MNLESGVEKYVPKTGDAVYIDGLKDERPAEVVGVTSERKAIVKRPDNTTAEIEFDRLEPADVEHGQVDLLSDEDVEGEIEK